MARRLFLVLLVPSRNWRPVGRVGCAEFEFLGCLREGCADGCGVNEHARLGLLVLKKFVCGFVVGWGVCESVDYE